MKNIIIILSLLLLSSFLISCEKNGPGEELYTNGEKYVGVFKDGKKHGQGTYTWTNGNMYVGEYKDDLKHGQGTYTWNDGVKFVGEFKDGEIWNGREFDKKGRKSFIWVNGKKP